MLLFCLFLLTGCQKQEPVNHNVSVNVRDEKEVVSKEIFSKTDTISILENEES